MLKSHLDHIFPTGQACRILGRPVVHRIVSSLLRVRMGAAAVSLDRVESVVNTLFLLSTSTPAKDELGIPGAVPPPPPASLTLTAAEQQRLLALDKHLLWRFIVPAVVQPHSGSGGHMGLFDCLVYMMQGHGPGNGSLVWMTDVLIVWAVCVNYRRYQERARALLRHPKKKKGEEKEVAVTGDEEEEDKQRAAGTEMEPDEDDDKVVWTMAILAFRMYDSYQKKGSVARDTIHRFMTDVHGDDSYKKPKTQALLDQIFDDSRHDAGWLQNSVSENIFCKRVMSTFTPGRPHWLLDWLSLLQSSMVPLEEVPHQVAAYLDTIDHKPTSLCETYALTEQGLFEIKRRFHSLVQSSSPVIQGDPMGSSSVMEELNQPPRHVIRVGAFCQAVCQANEEMGNGGFLPESLAKLVFATGCRKREVAKPSQTLFWNLYDVVNFGCLTVRHAAKHDAETTLLRFMFQVFQQEDGVAKDESLSNDSHRVLNREQIARMFVLLVELDSFRRRRDTAVEMEDDDNDNESMSSPADPLESTICEALGVLPSCFEPSGSKIDPMQLASETLRECGTADPDAMSFEEFCKWNKLENGSTKKKPKSKLDPLIIELRLIAAVLFGIPPTLASVEVELIETIEKRHKSRYPQNEAARRGPRGTVWYFIAVEWLTAWASLVKRVVETEEDARDGRGEKGTYKVRGLPKINNAGLLVENGDLALRPDVRWKVHYEILPPLAWSALHAWYDGGPPIHRSVVKFIDTSGTLSPHSNKPVIPTESEIELHPLFVSIYMADAASRGEARPFQQNYQLSRVTPVGITLVQLCRELEVDPVLARLWVCGNDVGSSATDDKSGEDWILSPDKNITDQRKRRGKSHGKPTLLLELKDQETGFWPRGLDGKDWTFVETTKTDTMMSDLGDGVVGLYNMGNTCYLNSSIQCLSHTPILREYFTSRGYLKDINTTNPLGHQGHLAQVSAVLVNSLWKRFSQSSRGPKRIVAPATYAPINAPALTPKTFKDSLGKVNDLFAGNEQHDAQEFLAFLLGGLSEDLNRIVEKPYMEAPDSDGRPDKELADIWWSNHLKREMSIVVALFTGQFKSLLTCRSCKYESARFEPYSFLQLPLPEDDHLAVKLILYPKEDDGEPMRYCVRIKVNGNLDDVTFALAKLLMNEENGVVADGKDDGDSTSGNESPFSKEQYQQKANNLFFADMRDSYVLKIVPKKWILQDLQNKETGELPLLHVFELDDLQQTSSDKDATKEEGKVVFLAISQRRTELISRDHLHPLNHRLFGTPLLIRIENVAHCTGNMLYDLVARKIRKVVPKSAWRFLSPDSETATAATNAENPSTDDDLTRTYTDDVEVAAGSVPRYGYRLRLTTREGRKCGTCQWYDCCIGCFIPDDDAPADIMDGDSITVDWHFAVDVATNGFGYRTVDPCVSQPTTVRGTPKRNFAGLKIQNHRSCDTGNKKGNLSNAITLEDCLDAFAKEEKIPEAYCSSCKDFRVQMKRMSLWRLPPVVIIQLKRFQFTQHMRRKLPELVVFPLEGLDLSRIMAQEEASNGLNGEAPNTADGAQPDSEGDMEMLKDCGRAERLYDLYGVIHHQGALSGGHYVASLKSEVDGHWRLFNDAQVFEIHARDVVDPSAYILFYIRRDASKAELSDFWDVREAGGVSEADIEQLVRGRSDKCVIS